MREHLQTDVMPAVIILLIVDHQYHRPFAPTQASTWPDNSHRVHLNYQRHTLQAEKHVAWMEKVKLKDHTKASSHCGRKRGQSQNRFQTDDTETDALRPRATWDQIKCTHHVGRIQAHKATSSCKCVNKCHETKTVLVSLFSTQPVVKKMDACVRHTHTHTDLWSMLFVFHHFSGN